VTKAIVLLSGGIDSTTALALTRRMGMEVHAIIARYGQTLDNEVDVARDNALRWGAEPVVVELPMRMLDAGCTLLRDSADSLPRDRTRDAIEQAGTPSTYVPFRNGILFAWAAAYGESRAIRHIYAGCNGLLSGNYWDDTREFASAMEAACRAGTTPEYAPEIHVPFAHVPKSGIVSLGMRLGVDYSKTTSCYSGVSPHCGACDSCVQRADAMRANGCNIEGKFNKQ
jgi:7-cyano-7-deazaguanine synthase